jgi:hypothetical protein
MCYGLLYHTRHCIKTGIQIFSRITKDWNDLYFLQFEPVYKFLQLGCKIIENIGG